MQVFQFENQEAQPKRRNRVLPLVAGLALLSVVGTTLAANIGINTNSNNTVNFGQGIAQAVSCDPDGITISPTSSAPQNIGNNPSVTATWYLASITISGVSDLCAGKTFSVAAFNSTATGLQIGQVENAAGANPVSDAVYSIAMQLSSTTGWSAVQTGTKDFTVSGTWTNDNNNTVVVNLWYPNGDPALLTGWTAAVHNDAIGVVSADLMYFTVETTE